MRDLACKTAFVTGGGSGIGLALGRCFAASGLHVMLADIDAEALAAALDSLRGLSPGVRGVACDVADAASVDRAPRRKRSPASAACISSATMPASAPAAGSTTSRRRPGAGCSTST